MKNDLPLATPARSSFFRWLIPLLLLAIILAGGTAWAVKNKNKGALAAAKPAEKPLVMELAPRDVATIVNKELRTNLSLSGTLMPLNQTTVKSKVAAEVRQISVQEGDKVTRGQIIAQLDVADLKARLASQQATLDEARARLALAEKNRETNRALLNQNFISQNAFDGIASSADVGQASVRAAEAQWQIARRAMDDAVVRSPMDGIISKRFVQPGEKINFDAPLAAIVSLNQMELEAPVPANEIPRIKAGQTVDFNVDGFNGRAFAGKVARINPSAESGSRSIMVYVSVDNADNALKGGMFAKGTITLEKSAAVPVAPISALREEKGQTVLHQIVDGKIVAQPVTLGLRNEDEGVVEIKSGAVEGAVVIAAKLDTLKPGAMVKLFSPSAVAVEKKPDIKTN
jgi:membrane fusion protein, multidrug efflux system